MVVGYGQGQRAQVGKKTLGRGLEGRLGGAVPAPGPVTPTGYASQMLQEGRDINGEDKTQTW